MASAERATIATFAPSAASAYAVALPMPLDAPVTIATCPFSLPSATLCLPLHLIHRRERAGHLHEFDGIAERVLGEEAGPVINHARLADRHLLRIEVRPHRLDVVHLDAEVVGGAWRAEFRGVGAQEVDLVLVLADVVPDQGAILRAHR